MNILVTGGKGFVGAKIVNYLKRDYVIFSPSRAELDLRNLDSVTAYFDNNKIDYVIHCALSGRELLDSTDPEYFVDGLLMFRNIWLNRTKFNKFINLGTMLECNQFEDNTNFDEYHFLNHLPITSYGLAKNIIARIISETDKFFNLRLFGVFHETENENRFFKKIIKNPEVIINEDKFIDFIYLDDIFPVIDIILNDKANDKHINVVYNKKYKLSELAYMLCDNLNLNKTKIKIINPNGKNFTGDDSKISNYKLKFIGLEEGLKRYTL